jgi:ABC-type transport system involved in multi-copper enzyme maturation permease subunit
MYVWKCWRDTRAFFAALAVISAAVTPISAALIVHAGLHDGFGRSIFISTVAFILFIVALGLGAIGAVQEFTDKTAHFLFTKPRSRAYFVWVGWAVGCVEFLAIILVNLLSGLLTFVHYNKVPLKTALIGLLKVHDIGLIISTLILFSLTYSMTAALRNGLKGLGASMGTATVVQAAAIGIRLRWNFDVVQLIDKLPPLVSSIGWILLALLMVFATQLIVDRAEI